jgi:hypothetical protein
VTKSSSKAAAKEASAQMKTPGSHKKAKPDRTDVDDDTNSANEVHVMCSLVEDHWVDFCHGVARTVGWTFHSTPPKRVLPTHVVTESTGKASFKVMLGLSSGAYIVTPEWAQACLEAESVIDAAPFQVPHYPRVGDRAGKLFAGKTFGFAGFSGYKKGDEMLSVEELQRLVQVSGGSVVTSMALEVCDFVVFPRQLDFWGKHTANELGLSLDFVCSRAKCGRHLEDNLAGTGAGGLENAPDGRGSSWSGKRSRTRLVVWQFIIESVKMRELQCPDAEAYAFRCPKDLSEECAPHEVSADYGVSFSQEF